MTDKGEFRIHEIDPEQNSCLSQISGIYVCQREARGSSEQFARSEFWPAVTQIVGGRTCGHCGLSSTGPPVLQRLKTPCGDRKSSDGERKSMGSRVHQVLFAVVALLALQTGAIAATERYDYAPLGRLIRFVNTQGQVTEYVYDPAGKLREVHHSGQIEAPSVISYSPDTLRRGECVSVLASGMGPTASRVTSSLPKLQISNVRVDANSVRFDFAYLVVVKT